MTANETPQIPPTLDEATVNSIVEMINLLAAARDAMSDEIVTRLARTVSEGMTLLDRLTRNKGLMRMLEALESPQGQQLLIGLSEAFRVSNQDIATTVPAKGGLGGLLSVARQPGTQEGMRILAIVGQHLSSSLREGRKTS